MAEQSDLASTDGSEQLSTIADQLLDASLNFSLNLLSAIVILAIGLYFAGYMGRLTRQRLEAIDKFDRTLIPVLAQIVRFVCVVLVLVVVLAQFGVQTTSIIAVLGAAGLAIGLALQGTLQNVAAGIMLLILRPFKVGDYIEAGDDGGTVDAIGLFQTRMHRVDDVFVAVPNASIWSGKIVNYSMRPRRRLDILVGISYDDDIDKAVEVLRDLISSDPRVIAKPEPLVVVKNLGDSSVDLEIRAWTKRTVYWDLRFDMIRAIKYALDEAGISIPYPHRQIVISASGDAAPASLAATETSSSE